MVYAATKGPSGSDDSLAQTAYSVKTNKSRDLLGGSRFNLRKKSARSKNFFRSTKSVKNTDKNNVLSASPLPLPIGVSPTSLQKNVDRKEERDPVHDRDSDPSDNSQEDVNEKANLGKNIVDLKTDFTSNGDIEIVVAESDLRATNDIPYGNSAKKTSSKEGGRRRKGGDQPYVSLGELTKFPVARTSSVPIRNFAEKTHLHSPSNISDLSVGLSNFQVGLGRHQSVPSRDILTRPTLGAIDTDDASNTGTVRSSFSKKTPKYHSKRSREIIEDLKLRRSASYRSQDSKHLSSTILDISDDPLETTLIRSSSYKSTGSKSNYSKKMARKKTPPSRFVRSASNRSTGSRGSTRSRSRSRKNSGTTTLPSATNFRRSSSNRSNGSRISTASRVSTASVGSTKSNSSGKNNLSKVQTPYAIRRSSSNRSTVSKSHKKKKDLKKKATTEITRPAPPPRESSDKSQPGCKNTENSKGSLKVRTRSLSPRKSVKSPAGFGVSSPGFIKPINFQEMSRVRSPLGGVTNASKSISPPRSNQIRRNSRSPFQAPAGSSQSVYSIGKTKGQSRKVVTSRKKGISPSKKGVRLHGSPKKNKSKNMFATNKKLNRRPFLRQGRIGKPELNPKSKKIVTKRIGDVDVAVPTPVMPSKSHKKEFNAGVIEKKKRSVGKKKAGQDSRQKKVVHMEKKGDSKSDLSGFYTDDEIAVINDTGSLTKLKVVNEEEQSELSNSSSDSDMSDDSKKGLEHYNYYKEKAYNLRKTTSAPLNRTSSKKDEMGLRWCRKGDLYLRQGDDRLAINAYHTSLHATKSSLQFGVSPLLASDYDKKAARKLVSGLLVKAQKDLETRAIKTEGNGASNSSEDENELVSTVTSEDQSEAKPMLFDNSGTLRKRMESCSKALDEYTDSLEKYRKRVCLSDYVRRKRRILEDKMRLYQEELEKTHSRTGQLLPRVADLLLEIGSAHEKRGNISSAVAFYQEGIRVRKASLADDYRKLTLKNLGVATVNDKENDRAVEALITSLHRCRESGEKKYPFLENSDLFRELTVSPNNDVGCTKPDFDKYDWSLPEINWGAFKFPSTFSEFKGLFMLNEEQIDDVSTILTKEAKEVPGISRYNLKYLLKEAVKDFGVGLGAFGEAFDLNDTTIDKFVKGIVSATPTFIRPVPDHDDYYLSFSSGSFFSESECSFDSRDYSRMSPPPMSSRMSPRMSRSRSENTGMRDYRSTKEYRSSRRGRHYNRINSISTSGTYDVDSEDDSSFVSGASIGSWLAMGMGKKAGEIVDTMDKTTGYGFNNENILVARSISTILSKTRSEPSVAPKGRNLHEQGSEESEETTKFHNVSRKEGKNKKQSKKRLKKRKKKNEIEEDATFESVPLGVSTTSHGSF